MSNSSKGWGIDHLANLPITVTYAIVIVVALLGLALLRHFSLKVDA